MVKKEKVSIADSLAPALSKTTTGSLIARLFDDGILEVESPNTVSIQIERLDLNHELPKGAVYKISLYYSHPEDKENMPGAVYINNNGEFLLPNGEEISMRKKPGY
jgi:hypothetical protein